VYYIFVQHTLNIITELLQEVQINLIITRKIYPAESLVGTNRTTIIGTKLSF